jgi:hypothetical protein
MTNVVYIICLIAIAFLAFSIGKKLALKTESKTTTFLIKSIQAIAELAVLEYVTEGIADIKEMRTDLIFARWKKGLLRYTAKIKVGFDISQLEHTFDDVQQTIQIKLPHPKVLSCEIYNRKFYKLPREKAEDVPWKWDTTEDFSSDEVLALDNEARSAALKNVNEFGVLDLLQNKTRLVFENIFSLSYPKYSIKILTTNKNAQEEQQKLPGNN